MTSSSIPHQNTCPNNYINNYKRRSIKLDTNIFVRNRNDKTKTKFKNFIKSGGYDVEHNNKMKIRLMPILSHCDKSERKLTQRETTQSYYIALYILFLLSHKKPEYINDLTNKIEWSGKYRISNIHYQNVMDICEVNDYNLISRVVCKLKNAGMIDHIQSKKAVDKGYIYHKMYHERHTRDWYSKKVGHEDKWLLVQLTELDFKKAGFYQIVWLNFKKIVDNKEDSNIIQFSINNDDPPDDQPSSHDIWEEIKNRF